MPTMSKEAAALFNLFSQDTYCINVPKSPARDELVALGALEWVPAPSWSGSSTYALTAATRAEIWPKENTDGTV